MFYLQGSVYTLETTHQYQQDSPPQAILNSNLPVAWITEHESQYKKISEQKVIELTNV